jgi:hypothetical protein
MELAVNTRGQMGRNPKPTTFEDFKFLSQVDDYRTATITKDLFNDQNFRNSILNAKYLEFNQPMLDYLKRGSTSGLVSEKSILNKAKQGTLIDPILTGKLGREIPLGEEDLKKNVIDLFPALPTERDTGVSSVVTKEEQDALINERLKYIFNNPLNLAGDNSYAFTVLDKQGNKYTIPTFEQTKSLLDIEERSKQGIDVQPAVTDVGFDFDMTPIDFETRSPEEETKRYFKLLKNMGLDELKIAEFMYAEQSGIMEQFRTKHGVTDLLKLVPYVLKGVGEAVADATIEVNNTFKEDLKTTPLGSFIAPKIDTTGDMFSKTKFAADIINEKTDGVLSVDNATAILAYSPDFATTLKREGFIGLTTYAITGGLGLTMGQIKSGAFRNWAKNTFQSKTFEGALKNANKKGLTDADIFERYWQDGNIGFLNGFRKNMTMFSMKMAQEAKGIFDPKQRVRVNFLKQRLDAANQKYANLSSQFQKGQITQQALNAQAKVVARIERNMEAETLKSLVPESFRSLFKDELGVTFGIASVNHYYQMDSVDPENIQPNFLMMLLGGIGGTIATETGINGVKGFTNSLKDHLGYMFLKDFDNPKYKGKAKDVYKWLSLADPKIQEDIFASIDGHRAIGEKISGLMVDGKPLVSNPEAFNDVVYKLVGLIGLRNAGDQVLDSIKHSEVRDFSDGFQKFLLNQRDKVSLYNELSTGINQLRKARLHPDMQADEASKQIIDNYIAMYDSYAKHLREYELKADQFATKLENDLSDMVDGLKANPDDFKPTVLNNYASKLEILSNHYISKDVFAGYTAEEAVKRANEKLDKFDLQIRKNLDTVDSITSNVPVSSNSMYQGYSKINQTLKNNADGKFIYLKNTYGRNSSNPVFMDATDFYGLIKNYDAPDFQDFFEEGELFVSEVSRGAKNIANIKPGVLPNKFEKLFDDAAGKFLADENVRLLSPDLQEAIKIVKDENPDASNFQIWKELYDEGRDVKLPIGFDDWKIVAQTMGSKAYQKMGSLQGKENYSLYEYWVDLAEDEVTGFSLNFFNPNAKESAFVGGEVLEDWRLAKGAWQDWASRYKSGYGKDWGKIIGKDPSGAVILSKDPTVWVQDIINRLGSKNLTQDEADKVVSDIAQVFGGTNISQGGGVARWSFDGSKNSTGLKLAQKIIQRAGKQLLLNSDAGQLLLNELRGRDVIRPGDLPKLKGTEKFQTFLNNLDLLKTSTGQQLVNKTEVEEALDVQQLYAYSSEFNKKAKQIQTKIKNEITTIKNELAQRQTGVFKGLKEAKDNLLRQFTPDYIHSQIKLGKQGIEVLDQTRNTYSKLLLDQLGVSSIADLNSNQARNYEGLMKEYDRAIAGRALEFVENSAKVADNTSLPKVEISPIDGQMDISTNDLIKGQTMMNLLGKGTDWEKSFRELVKRGSVDGTDEVFDNYITIAGYMTGEQVSKIPFTIQGIPRSLSMASWVSRAYAWQRGVIGTQFLGTEAAIHAIRKGKYGMFEEMMNNPEVGRIVVKMLEEGEPPNFKDRQALEKAFISILARNQAQADQDDDPRTEELNKFSKEIKKKRKNIESQMQDISKKSLQTKVIEAVVPDRFLNKETVNENVQ